MKSLPRTRFMSPTAKAKKQENGAFRVYPNCFHVSLSVRWQTITFRRFEQQALLVHEEIPSRGIEERVLPARSPGVIKQDFNLLPKIHTSC